MILQVEEEEREVEQCSVYKITLDDAATCPTSPLFPLYSAFLWRRAGQFVKPRHARAWRHKK